LLNLATLAVCSGELDAGFCSPTMVRKFSELIEADQVQIMPSQGHQLARTAVQSVVGQFLTQTGWILCRRITFLVHAWVHVYIFNE
jgi:hypothetical protein